MFVVVVEEERSMSRTSNIGHLSYGHCQKRQNEATTDEEEGAQEGVDDLVRIALQFATGEREEMKRGSKRAKETPQGAPTACCDCCACSN